MVRPFIQRIDGSRECESETEPGVCHNRGEGEESQPQGIMLRTQLLELCGEGRVHGTFCSLHSALCSVELQQTYVHVAKASVTRGRLSLHRRRRTRPYELDWMQDDARGHDE